MTMYGTDETHDPSLRSWVVSADGHLDFPIQNLPLGVFSPAGGLPRCGVAIGGEILDLQGVWNLLPAGVADAVAGPTLNDLFSRRSADRVALRRHISALLTTELDRSAVERHLHDGASCQMHLPASIGDYSDFFVGIHHARTVGTMFRPGNALMPNYKWLPIGYHGRASSIRPSGVPVVRPNGQRIEPDASTPEYGPSHRLDYELEMGIWLGAGNELGTPIGIADAADHVVGLCLLNDWSARDMQTWEYQPLGPFLAKSFHTSVSPWVVTAEALAPFRIAQPSRPQDDPSPLPYLTDQRDLQSGAFAVQLEVHLSTRAMRDAGLAPALLSRGPMSNMYWTIAQILAHQTSNGCNIRPGDLLGTGTISAVEREGRGCLLEITQGGREPVSLSNGESRTFLLDGDEVTMSATARADGFVPIGFGPCSAVITPAPAL
jgi:fumarylacetoacetase